ncbi:MAG TPA: hypothetical protein VF332_01150 [Vicinamibacterales bacterium]
MYRTTARLATFVLACLSVAGAATAEAQADQAVPRLVKFTGVVAGTAGPVDFTFAFYADQMSETPLWTETQHVTVDETGRYAVYLGASRPEGLPAELFAAAEARWLGVRVAGQAEQPRVLLVSVPYALKAADAETVGGKPLSAFVLAGTTTGTGADGLTYVDTRVLKQGLSAAGPLPQGAGTPGAIAKYTAPACPAAATSLRLGLRLLPVRLHNRRRELQLLGLHGQRDADVAGDSRDQQSQQPAARDLLQSGRRGHQAGGRLFGRRVQAVVRLARPRGAILWPDSGSPPDSRLIRSGVTPLPER